MLAMGCHQEPDLSKVSLNCSPRVGGKEDCSTSADRDVSKIEESALLYPMVTGEKQDKWTSRPEQVVIKSAQSLTEMSLN